MNPPRDILVLTLRNLRVGEDVYCTPRTHAKITPRVQAFQRDHAPCRFNLFRQGALGFIRRTR